MPATKEIEKLGIREDGLLTVNHDKAFKLLSLNYGIKPVVLLGPTGCGKSTINQDFVKSLSQRLGETVELKTFYPSQWEPTDFKGFPSINGEYASWAKHKKFFEAPKHKTVWFFDEITNAAPSVQDVLLELFRERTINDEPIPSNVVAIVGAGNLTEDSLGANDMIEPLAERCALAYLRPPNVSSFIRWNMESNIMEPTVFAYLQFNEAEIFLKKETDRIFPCPRAWTDSIKTMQASKDLTPADKKLIVASNCGVASAEEYEAFAELEERIPKWGEVLSGKAPFQDEKQWAILVLTTIALNVQQSDVPKLLKFMDTLKSDLFVYLSRCLANREEGLKNQLLTNTRFLDQVKKMRKYTTD
jgi:hypothetical protein